MAATKPDLKKIRQPIVTVLGHIDHGKTSLLDYIRGTFVNAREAAGMTQHIGASSFPIQSVIDFCGPKYKNLKINIPGLLVIDTPGHGAFMNLRKRGGAVADIAILVVDVTAGTMPITWEAVRILRERKVPFIIAANKIDLIQGWKSTKDADFLDTYNKQADYVKEDLDKRIYQLIGDFIDEGFAGCERYDRVTDFTKNIAIVPTSAKTGEGLPSLFIVLIGLVQQYLMAKIKYSEGPGKGVVLEVKEDPKLGPNLDCLLYDGIFRKNQTIVIGGINKPIRTKIRAMLVPNALEEIRDPEHKFLQKDVVYAAAGVKILAPDLADAVAGAPIKSIEKEEEYDTIYKEVEDELQEIQIKTDDKGVIVKADTLGSLEAINKLFSENGIKIRFANVGAVSKKDVSEAVAVREHDPFNAVILTFNVKILKDAEEEANHQGIRIFSSDIIYRLMEDFKDYHDKRVQEEKDKAFSEIILPGKVKIIPDFIFRRSDPVVVGVKVVAGQIVPKVNLVNQDGVTVGKLKQIQNNNQNVESAKAGEEVAISITGATIGRSLKIEDDLYIAVPESHVRMLRGKYRSEMTEEQLGLLKELIIAMRKKNENLWGA